MNKKLIVSTKKLSLSRESLRRIDLSQEQLRDAHGGLDVKVSTISSKPTSTKSSDSISTTFSTGF